jgi:hypothetical protein
VFPHDHLTGTGTGGQAGDQVLHGIPLQWGQGGNPRGTEEAGGEVGPERSPVRAVGHRRYGLHPFGSTSPGRQSHEKPIVRSIRQSIGALSEETVGKGRVSDHQDGSTTGASPENGYAQKHGGYQCKKLNAFHWKDCDHSNAHNYI